MPFVDIVGVRPAGRAKWALRPLPYRQRSHRATHGRYATNLGERQAGDIRVDGLDFTPVLDGTPSRYEVRGPSVDGASVPLTEDGRVRVGNATSERP